MAIRAVLNATAVLLALTGCSAAAPSPPAPFDPSKGTPTDKVRWGGQFALANGTSTGNPADEDGQARVVEQMSRGICSGLEHGSVKDEINGLTASPGSAGQHDTIVFTAIAVNAYCPQHKAEFDALMKSNKIALQPTTWTPADNQYGGPTSTAKATTNG